MDTSPAAHRRLLAALSLVLLTASELIAKADEVLSGVIRVPVGAVVVDARITWIGGTEVVHSDAHGRFEIVVPALPGDLRIEHPLFETQDLRVENLDPLEIVLIPRPILAEELSVRRSRGGDPGSPASISSTLVDPEESTTPPRALSDLLSGSAGVSENGQGGLFQVLSIRGVSRQRVQTRVSQMRIVSDRRAGTAASFIDPLLVASVDLMRGPSSTLYGAGALGGVIEIEARRFGALNVDSGYLSAGNESFTRIGWGNENTSLALAYRRAQDDRAPDGTRRFSRFEQSSAVLEHRWSLSDLEMNLLAIASLGTDIGKVSADFPERETLYPQEEHLLVKLAVTSKNAPWRAFAYAHPNRLVTEVDRKGRSFSRVTNRAFDLGGGWQRRLEASERMSFRLGFEYFGRRRVDVDEMSIDSSDPTPTERVQRPLDGAREDEWGGVVAMNWRAAEHLTLEAGLRLIRLSQDNGGGGRVAQSDVGGFLGLVFPLSAGWQATAAAGNGLRFASLGERFFTGTTGRGIVTGSVGLAPERSRTFEIGMRRLGRRFVISSWLFSMTIDDYIERVRVPVLPGEIDQFTFRNLTAGTIRGIEVEAYLQMNDRWSAAWSGHRIDGRDDGGRQPLVDVPVDRLRLRLRRQSPRWNLSIEAAYRGAKKDPADGEFVIADATIYSASLAVFLHEQWTLGLSFDNLTDASYFPSADDKAVRSSGRSIGLSIGFQGRKGSP